jgi:hypothetical protein
MYEWMIAFGVLERTGKAVVVEELRETMRNFRCLL